MAPFADFGLVNTKYAGRQFKRPYQSEFSQKLVCSNPLCRRVFVLGGQQGLNQNDLCPICQSPLEVEVK